MYYDIEEEFQKPEPDIDEQLKNLRNRKALAEKEFRSSGQTDEDRRRFDYVSLAIAEQKCELLEKKLMKKDLEISELSREVSNFKEYCRFSASERLFLWLLCGFVAVLCLSPLVNVSDFLLRLFVSPIIAFFAALTNVLFPKYDGRYNVCRFYEDHPYFYAIICFIIVAALISLLSRGIL